MFNITDWNINPNQDWYVRLSDVDDSILVELYGSQSDMAGSINLVASGVVDFGINKEVLFSFLDITLSFFNSDLNYHLKVSGVSGDTTKSFHLSPFVDLPEVNNSIYRSEALILRRAKYEINKHTHIINEKQISLATLVDGLRLNDKVYLNSSSRGSASYNIVTGFSISGSAKNLISSITIAEYSDFVK